MSVTGTYLRTLAAQINQERGRRDTDKNRQSIVMEVTSKTYDQMTTESERKVWKVINTRDQICW